MNMALARSVKISDPGDSDFREGQIVLKDELNAVNEKLDDDGKAPARGRKPKPATAATQLLGITKAALQSESFISAASFQETTKVLTEAALGSAIDTLNGLKENVILGHLIPAGTAFKPFFEMQVDHLGEPIEEEIREVTMAMTRRIDRSSYERSRTRRVRRSWPNQSRECAADRRDRCVCCWA